MQVDSTTDEKICVTCRESKSLDEFGRDRHAPGGIQRYCKPCIHRRARESYLRNREAIRSRARERRKVNPPTKADPAKAKLWYERTRDQRRAVARQYYLEHREHILNKRRLERARVVIKKPEKRNTPSEHFLLNQSRRSDEGVFSWEEWKAVCQRYGDRCLRCGDADVLLTPDHIVPLSKGGTNWISNIQPLCLRCNQRKGTKTIDYRPLEQAPLL